MKNNKFLNQNLKKLFSFENVKQSVKTKRLIVVFLFVRFITSLLNLESFLSVDGCVLLA